jgi:hypothetical protein
MRAPLPPVSKTKKVIPDRRNVNESDHKQIPKTKVGPHTKQADMATTKKVGARVNKRGRCRKSTHRDKLPAEVLPARSWEDLYDDAAEEVLPKIKSNSGAPHTCFFWYHVGFCARSLGPEGCMLRYALLEPPSVVLAPPGFIHSFPCGLQWCASGSVGSGGGQQR